MSDRADKPAFPVATETIVQQKGVTIRELFTAMAMQGILASPSGPNLNAEEVAENARATADATLRELELP